MKIIETQNLQFGFRKDHLVLKDINLKIERGCIYGFLGPNGAGKTTTIRLLLGLLTPNSGNVKLFDKPVTNSSLETFDNIGTMIETPSLYEHLTGLDNLEITRKLKNVPINRINKVLEIVKLTNSAKTKVKEYSLGMKQRLGLALALLSEPQLLILDEPTNGLDPQGMIETRELLHQLNEEFGITILISSHLLSEIEKLVTHLGIIKNGELVFQGTIQELHHLKSGHSLIQIDTNDNDAAIAVLRNYYEINFNNDNRLEIAFQKREQVSHICKTLVNEDLEIYYFNVTSNDLESIFLNITNN
jgi:ABC-2 type transport system ATP-binding protein